MRKILVAALALTYTSAFAQDEATTVAPVGQSTTISIDETAAAPSKWGVTAFVEASANTATVNKGNAAGKVRFDNYVAPSYKLNDDQKLQLRVAFTVNATDEDKSTEYDIDDPVLRFTDAKAFQLGSQQFNHDIRAYLPASDKSRELGAATLRYISETDVEAGAGFVVTPGLDARLYNRSSSGQTGYKAAMGAMLSKQYGKLKPLTYAYHQFRDANTQDRVRSLKGEALDPLSDKDSALVGFGLDYKINNNFSVLPYVEQEYTYGKKNWTMLNDDETTYYIDLTATM